MLGVAPPPSWRRGSFFRRSSASLPLLPAMFFVCGLKNGLPPATLERRMRGMQKVPPTTRYRSCPGIGGPHFADFPGFCSRFCQDRKVIISLCHLALFWPRQGWGSRASEKCTFLGLGIAQRNAYFSVLAKTGGGRQSPTRSLLTMRAARGANA